MFEIEIPGPPFKVPREADERTKNKNINILRKDYVRRITQAYFDKYRQGEKVSGPIFLTITAYIPIPLSGRTSYDDESKMLSGDVLPARKPSLSYIADAVFEALTGHAWESEGQPVILQITKRYSQLPRLVIKAEAPK